MPPSSSKARQSAGQKALDLTKQMKNLDDLDLKTLLRLDGAELRRRGVPCQDRKRLLRFITGSFTLPRGGLQRSVSVQE